MDEDFSPKCSFSGCGKNAELYCKCRNFLDYICNDHKNEHISAGTGHCLVKAYVDVDTHLINKFIEVINSEINYFKNYKYSIVSKTNEIMSFLNQNCSKAIKSLDEILIKKSSEILSLRLSNKLFHSKSHQLTALTRENPRVLPGPIDVTPVLKTITRLLSAPWPLLGLDPLVMSPYASLPLKADLLHRYGIPLKNLKQITHISVSIAAGIAVVCKEKGIMKLLDLKNKGDKLKIIAAPNNLEISCLAITRNNKYILTGIQSGIIKVWDIETKGLFTELIGHSGRVSILCETNNERLASAGWDGSLKLWNLSNFELIAEENGLHAKRLYGSVTCMCASNDDSLIITGGHDGCINAYEVVKKRIVRSFAAHKGTVKCFAVTSDGRILVSGGADKVIKVINLVEGRLKATLSDHSAAIFALMMSVDGRYFISAGEKNKIIIFRMNEGEKIKQADSFELWKDVFPEIYCLSN